MSNFHNAAETDVNLTGRKQVLIQKSCCLFFDGNTARYLRKKILNRTQYGLIFQKREKGFSFEKDLERNENFCRFVFRKRKGFLFYVQPNGKNRLILFTEKLSGRKTAFIQKASNRLTREQNFLIIDWHCYIIITIVTKK